MKWRVIIRPNAETDLRQAWSWYEEQRAGLGDEFLSGVHADLRFIEENPVRRPIYYRNFRRMLTARFPYKKFLYCGKGSRNGFPHSACETRPSPTIAAPLNVTNYKKPSLEQLARPAIIRAH